MFVFNSLHSNLKLSYNIVDNLVYCDFLSIENDHTLFKNVESQNPGSLGFRCRNRSFPPHGREASGTGLQSTQEITEQRPVNRCIDSVSIFLNISEIIFNLLCLPTCYAREVSLRMAQNEHLHNENERLSPLTP